MTTEAGRWIKLTEESLAKFCDKPTAMGYALCYSDAAKKLLLEDVEVCGVCVRVGVCVCACAHVISALYRFLWQPQCSHKNLLLLELQKQNGRNLATRNE